jgi:hypothetical protein
MNAEAYDLCLPAVSRGRALPGADELLKVQLRSQTRRRHAIVPAAQRFTRGEGSAVRPALGAHDGWAEGAWQGRSEPQPERPRKRDECSCSKLYLRRSSPAWVQIHDRGATICQCQPVAAVERPLRRRAKG